MFALSSIPPSQAVPDLLILAHKADLLRTTAGISANASSLAVARVKSVLERELEKRRASQTGVVGIEGLGDEGEKSEMGGLECTGTGEFKFAEWETGEVAFIATSVKPTEEKSEEKSGTLDGLDDFSSWVDSLR